MTTNLPISTKFVSFDNATTASVTTELVSCHQVDEVENACVIYSLPAAVIIITVAAFFRTRRLLCLSCCQGRPAVAFPMDLVEEHERKWSYAAVFGVLAYRALRLMDKNYYWQPPSFDNSEWSAAFGFSKVIIGMLNVVHVCFIFYPLLVCIRLRRIMAFNIIGFLYNALWLAITIVVFLSCAIPSGGEQHGSIERVLLVVFDVPVYVSHIILFITFILDFSINLSNAFRHKMIDRLPASEIQEQNNFTYVKSLLKKRSCTPPSGCFQKLIFKWKYVKVAGLAYSPRVICTMVVASFGLFKVGINMGVYFDKLLADFNSDLDYYAPTFDNLSANELFDRIQETFYIARPAFAASNAASLALHYIFIAHIIVCYRRNLLRYLRGDKSWHFNYSRNISPAKTLVLCMRYSGYQIAFIIYGWLVLMFFIFFVIMLINFTIVVPLNNSQSSAVINKFKEIWPTIVISILMLFLQILIAKFCFLQDKSGRVMALDNKRWFHVASYFLFFFNILLGIFSALRRFILSVLLELCLMSRLDKVLFMRGFESMDTGFSAYLSMLMTEEYLCHPVMRCFVHLLKDAVRQQHLSCVPKQEKRQRIRNRWMKAITLANNPPLVIDNFRKRLLVAEGMCILERSLSSELSRKPSVESIESINDWTYFEKRGDFMYEITRM